MSFGLCCLYVLLFGFAIGFIILFILQLAYNLVNFVNFCSCGEYGLCRNIRKLLIICDFISKMEKICSLCQMYLFLWDFAF
jgi:hypothetical protein